MTPRSLIHSTALRWLPTVTVVASAVLVHTIGLTDALDRRIQDVLVRWCPAPGSDSGATASSDPDVAIVAIDPRSLRAQPAWPWPRTLHARAIERLEDAGARVIAFDIDFSSPSTTDGDAALAERIASGTPVVLAVFSQTQRLAAGAEIEIVSRPVPVLERAAAAIGHVLVPIDADGLVRRAPGTSPIAEESIPSLARAALSLATSDSGQPSGPPGRERGTSNDRIDFRRDEPEIPVIAFVDLVEGSFDPALVAGRTVFIGATAVELQDLWATPIHPALPGVVIQAIAYRTAAAGLRGESITRDLPEAWAIALFTGLGLALRPRTGSGSSGLQRLGAPAIAVTGLAGISGLALAQWGWLLPLTPALGIVAVQHVLGMERLQRAVQARIAAHESSLSVLERLGAVSSRPRRGSEGRSVGSDEDPTLVLALELLGDVVEARGVVLLRADARGDLAGERLEWRPDRADDAPLELDPGVAAEVLRSTRPVERTASDGSRAPIVYSPLCAGTATVGVLVVFARTGRPLDDLHRRTIATVAAQLALTAQNLQLIERLRETFESSVAAIASAVEARDGYTDQHCRRLATFSSLVGARLGMPEAERRAMELGALLHDVGKIGIPDDILNKDGRLSGAERSVMQRHPEIGAQIVAPVIGLEQTTRDCIVHHHERWDGSGYPEGLTGDEIPLAARIVAIVDVWDALSTARPYKPAFGQEEVRALLLKGRGTQFDPELVDRFLEVLDEQGEEMLELIARSSVPGSGS